MWLVLHIESIFITFTVGISFRVVITLSGDTIARYGRWIYANHINFLQIALSDVAFRGFLRRMKALVSHLVILAHFLGKDELFEDFERERLEMA